jgi:sugar phosphate isomerase/epimerase
MKIAFANADYRGQDFQTAATLASGCGFDAVEIPGFDAVLCPPENIRQIFANANVKISALHVGSDLPRLASQIKLATEIGAAFVRLSADSLFSRTDTVSPGVIDQLLCAADTAAENGVTILIENQPVTGSALRMWRLLDRLNHPSVGCCWNTFTAAQAGDAPAVAVPLLNTRIRYVHLQDAKANTPYTLGQGDLPLRNTLNRLRGIGYDGYLLIGSAEPTAHDPVRLEQSLMAARTVLQQWQVLPTPVSA